MERRGRELGLGLLIFVIINFMVAISANEFFDLALQWIVVIAALAIILGILWNVVLAILDI